MRMDDCLKNYPRIHHALKIETEIALEEAKKREEILEKYNFAVRQLEKFQNIPEVIEALDILKSLPWPRA